MKTIINTIVYVSFAFVVAINYTNVLDKKTNIVVFKKNTQVEQKTMSTNKFYDQLFAEVK